MAGSPADMPYVVWRLMTDHHGLMVVAHLIAHNWPLHSSWGSVLVRHGVCMLVVGLGSSTYDADAGVRWS